MYKHTIHSEKRVQFYFSTALWRHSKVDDDN